MRRKKLPSRKRQALWRVLLALVSLLLVDHIFGIALLRFRLSGGRRNMRGSAGPGSLSGSGSRRSIKHIFST